MGVRSGGEVRRQWKGIEKEGARRREEVVEKAIGSGGREVTGTRTEKVKERSGGEE